MPTSPTSEGPKPESLIKDSKDFVEHLRTVHFTLLAVCLALSAIVSAGSPYVYRKANEQINEIADAAHNWDGGWLEKGATDIALNGAHPECSAMPFPPSTILINGKEIFTEFTGRTWNISSDDAAYMAVNPYIKHGFMFSMREPTSLDEFKKDWDSTFTVVCPFNLDNNEIWSALPGDQLVRYPLKQVAGMSEKSEKVFFQLRQNSAIGFQLPFGLNQKAFSYSGHSADRRLYVIPLLVTKAGRLPFRNVMAHALGKPTWTDVRFSDQFRELDNSTSGFQDLDFDHLRNIVRLEEKQSKEVFEAFGVKFPIETTTLWGIFIIFSLQIYFWIHLAEYRKREYPRTDVAWIGFYAGDFPRALFFITSVIVPSGVVGLLAFKFSPLRLFSSNIVMAIIFAAAFCWFAVRTWHESAKILDQNPK